MKINKEAVEKMKVGDNFMINGNIYQVKRIRKVMMAGYVALLICDALGDRQQRLVHKSEWNEEQNYWQMIDSEK